MVESTKRDEQLQRLHGLRQAVPHVSKSALHHILTDVAENGLPDLMHPKAMREGADLELNKHTAYGPLFLTRSLTMIDGTQSEFVIVNFLTLLYSACSLGGIFTETVQACVAQNGAPTLEAPWNLVLYTDECFPGNPLGAKAGKKLWVCYATFKEFHRSLHKEDLWLPIFVCRSSRVQQIAGHMSQVVKELLLSIFKTDAGNPEEFGILVHDASRRPFRFVFQFSLLVQDGSAHKYCFGVKGDSGSRYCLKCANVLQLETGLVEDEAVVKMPLSKSALVLSTDAAVCASFDRLEKRHGVCPSSEFAQWEQASGWSFSEHGIMACKELRPMLRPVSSFHHDWMHGVCQGCMNIYMYLILEALTEAGLQAWKNFTEFCHLWSLPAVQVQTTKLWDLFTPKRVEAHKKAKRLKISASEVLSLYPIMEQYVLTIGLKTDKQTECRAFLAMCRLVHLLQSTVHGSVMGRQLDTCAEECLQLGQACKWDAFFIKKFHWILHLGDTLELHGALLNCWAVERKHKQILRVGQDISNLKKYEMSVYKEVLAQQLSRLSLTPKPPFFLQTEGRPSKKMKQALETAGYTCDSCCDSLGTPFGTVKKGDYVLLSGGDGPWDCGEVWSHFAGGDNLFSIVALHSFQSRCVETNRAFWSKSGEPHMVLSSQLLACVTHAINANNVVTLIPWHLR